MTHDPAEPNWTRIRVKSGARQAEVLIERRELLYASTPVGMVEARIQALFENVLKADPPGSDTGAPAAGLAWTKEKPTVDGQYWCRPIGGGKAEIEQFFIGQGGTVCWSASYIKHIDAMEFAGPIPEPGDSLPAPAGLRERLDKISDGLHKDRQNHWAGQLDLVIGALAAPSPVSASTGLEAPADLKKYPAGFRDFLKDGGWVNIPDDKLGLAYAAYLWADARAPQAPERPTTRPMKLYAEKNGSNLVIWSPKKEGRQAYVGTICSGSLTVARAEEIAYRINSFEAPNQGEAGRSPSEQGGAHG